MYVEIQDNKREIELRKLFKLKKVNESRIGIDAYAKILNQNVNFEIKSTTVGNVSTARHLNLEHIERWRNQHWIIGVYDKKAILKHCYYGTPEDMCEWLDFWENDIKRGLKISDLLVSKIDKQVMYEAIGKKEYYTFEDAKKVFKQLYTVEEYQSMMNHPKGFRVRRMLEMFKEHNKVYLYRGSSLNNPKINKSYYEKWIKIDKNFDKKLRYHVSKYLNK